MLGALGELDLATTYLDRATERRPVFPGQVASTAFVLDARKGVARRPRPKGWPTPPARLVAGQARRGPRRGPQRRRRTTGRQLPTSEPGARRPRVQRLRRRSAKARTYARAAGGAAARGRAASRRPPIGAVDLVVADGDATRRLVVIGEPMSVRDGGTVDGDPAGQPAAARRGRRRQRRVGHVRPAQRGHLAGRRASRRAERGCATCCCGCAGPSATSSCAAGAGCASAPGVECDLHEFQRLAADALAAARADPELAGRLAVEAVADRRGAGVRRLRVRRVGRRGPPAAEQQLISLLDLLSVQAEDAGDLPGGPGARRAGAAPRPLHRLPVRPPRRAADAAEPGRRGDRRPRRRRRGRPGDGRGPPGATKRPPQRTLRRTAADDESDARVGRGVGQIAGTAGERPSAPVSTSTAIDADGATRRTWT